MKNKTKVVLIDILGFLCIIVAPFLGWLPGPGGIPMVILGLSLLANNHEWAERLVARVKEETSKASKKVTEADPMTKWAIDIAGIVFIVIAVLLITQFTKSITTTAAISLSLAAIIMVATNQNRHKRFWNTIKRKHKN